jgi:Concanavalin A-like lectin/glucanases superfamily
MVPIVLSCIVLVVVVYIVYSFIANGVRSNVLSTAMDLNSKNPAIKIDQPNATRSTISVWIKVVSWNTVREKVIYLLPGKVKLYLSATSPTLAVDIYTSTVTKTIVITYNFPIQKWTQICVTLDNAFVDCYVDGKFVKSIQLLSPQATNDDENIYVGGKPAGLNDILISTLKRYLVPQTPSNIYNEYLRGNGNYFFSNSFSSYGINLSLIRDNISSGSLRLM